MAPQVLDSASVSFTKFSVNLSHPGGGLGWQAFSVWEALVRSAHLPCRVVDTAGMTGYFLPKRCLQQTQCLCWACPASILSSLSIRPATQDACLSPCLPAFLPHSVAVALWPVFDPPQWICTCPYISSQDPPPGPGHHAPRQDQCGSLLTALPGPRLPHLESIFHAATRVSFPNCNSGHVLAGLKTLQ